MAMSPPVQPEITVPKREGNPEHSATAGRARLKTSTAPSATSTAARESDPNAHHAGPS